MSLSFAPLWRRLGEIVRAIHKIVGAPQEYLLRQATLEGLESRTLLTALPTGIHYSSDASYTLTGNAGAYTLDIDAGSWTFDDNIANDGNGTDFQGMTVNVHNASAVVFNSAETLAGLSLADTSKASISIGTGGSNGNVLDITSPTGLSIGSNTTIDAGDNDIVWADAGQAGVSEIQSLLYSGFNGSGGDWTGTGMITSAAIGTSGPTMALGFALNSSLPTSSQFTSFDGITVGSNDVLVKYTVRGDANLDGAASNGDLNIIRQHWLASGTTWDTGDSNYDGNTNNADLNMLRQNFQDSDSGASFDRTLTATGLTLAPVEGQDFTGTVATVTDLSIIDSGSSLPASDYQATIEWGNGTFYVATVTAAGGLGQFNISGTSPFPLSNPDALVLAEVGYTTASGLAGRPGALSEPIQIIPAVQGLGTTSVSAGQIDLNWADNATNASAIDVYRSTSGIVGFAQIATLSGSATSYADTDSALTENSQYYYEVAAVQPSGLSNFTNTANAWTLPATPTGLTATPDAIAGVDLNWTNNSTASTFEIDRAPAGSGDFAFLGNTDLAGYYLDDTGTPTVSYDYRVITIGDGGAVSAPSNTATSASLLQAPIGLTPSAVSTSEIDLAWTNVAEPITGAEIERSTDGGNTFTTLATVSATTTQYSDTALTEGTQYYYQLIAIDDADQSAASTPADCYTLPAAPSNLTAAFTTANGRNEADLSWTNNSTGASQVDVLRTDSSGATTVEASGPATMTSFSDLNIVGGQTYTYTIAAVAPDGGFSANSNSSAVTTPAASAYVQGTAISSSEIDLGWAGGISDATGLLVYESTDGTTYSQLTPTPLDPSATSYQATGLSQDSPYHFEIMAVGSTAVPSPSFSDPVGGATLPSTPVLSATASTNQVELSWTGDFDSGTTFNIYRADSSGNFDLLQNVTTTSYTDIGTSADTAYQYQVIAIGVGDNQSSPSNVPSITTGDPVPPPTGGGTSSDPIIYVDQNTTSTTHDGSSAHPFLTIQAAANLAAAPGEGSPVTVEIANGIYREMVTVRTNNITFVAENPGGVTVSGLDPVTFTSAANNASNIWTAQLTPTPSDATGVDVNDYSASTDMKVLGPSATTATDQVFVGGQPLAEARFPEVPISSPQSSDISDSYLYDNALAAGGKVYLLQIPDQSNYVAKNDYTPSTTVSSSDSTLKSVRFEDPNLAQLVNELGSSSALVGALIHINAGYNGYNDDVNGPNTNSWETYPITAVTTGTVGGAPVITYSFPSNLAESSGAPGPSHPGTVTTFSQTYPSDAQSTSHLPQLGDYYYISNFAVPAETALTVGEEVRTDSSGNIIEAHTLKGTAVTAGSTTQGTIATQQHPFQTNYSYVIDYNQLPTNNSTTGSTLYLHISNNDMATSPTNPNIFLTPPNEDIEVKTRDVAFDLSGRSNDFIVGIKLFAATITTDVNSVSDTIQNVGAQYLSGLDRTVVPDVALNQMSTTGTYSTTTGWAGIPVTVHREGVMPNYVEQVTDGVNITGNGTSPASLALFYLDNDTTPDNGFVEYDSGIELMGPADSLSGELTGQKTVDYSDGNGVTIGAAGVSVVGCDIENVDMMGGDNGGIVTRTQGYSVVSIEEYGEPNMPDPSPLPSDTYTPTGTTNSIRYLDTMQVTVTIRSAQQIEIPNGSFVYLDNAAIQYGNGTYQISYASSSTPYGGVLVPAAGVIPAYYQLVFTYNEYLPGGELGTVAANGTVSSRYHIIAYGTGSVGATIIPEEASMLSYIAPQNYSASPIVIQADTMIGSGRSMIVLRGADDVNVLNNDISFANLYTWDGGGIYIWGEDASSASSNSNIQITGNSVHDIMNGSAIYLDNWNSGVFIYNNSVYNSWQGVLVNPFSANVQVLYNLLDVSDIYELDYTKYGLYAPEGLYSGAGAFYNPSGGSAAAGWYNQGRGTHYNDEMIDNTSNYNVPTAGLWDSPTGNGTAPGRLYGISYNGTVGGANTNVQEAFSVSVFNVGATHRGSILATVQSVNATAAAPPSASYSYIQAELDDASTDDLHAVHLSFEFANTAMLSQSDYTADKNNYSSQFYVEASDYSDFHTVTGTSGTFPTLNLLNDPSGMFLNSVDLNLIGKYFRIVFTGFGANDNNGLATALNLSISGFYAS